MKKSVFAVAIAAVWMIGSLASAAPIDIFARQTSSTTWDVLVQANVDLGAIALTTTGFNSRTLNLEGVPTISAEDSPFRIQNGSVQVVVVWVPGASLLPAGSPETRLLTLVSSGGPTTIVPGDEAFGYTALDPRLRTILDYSFTLVSLDGTTITMPPSGSEPEPVTTPPVGDPVTTPPIPEPETEVVYQPPHLPDDSTGSADSPTPIPEPQSVVLFVAGFAVVAWTMARSRR